jgi:hypothetical protein
LRRDWREDRSEEELKEIEKKKGTERDRKRIRGTLNHEMT